METITILRASAGTDVDEQGNPVPGTEAETESEGWAVAPLTADEDSLATGQSVVEGFTLFRRDALVDILPDDRVRVRGEVYAVPAAAAKWINPYSGQLGTVVTVRRVA